MAVSDRKIVYYYNAICWNVFGDITHSISGDLFLLLILPAIVKNYSPMNQSAGNLHDEKGSSETIRVTSYNLSEFDQFGYWLAGLIDGDGYLSVSKTGYTSCEITLHESEVQILYYIKSILSGSVTKRIKSKAYRWRLHNKLGMEILIDLINGKLKTSIKHTQLIKVCNALNIRPIITSNISTQNAWFTGFFDGEGSFNCNSSTYQLSISLSQKDKTILENILIQFKVGSIYEDKSWKGYKYYLTSISDLKVIISFFENFPLVTRPKSTDFITFKKLLFRKERGDHLLPSNHPHKLAFVNLANTLINRKKI